MDNMFDSPADTRRKKKTLGFFYLFFHLVHRYKYIKTFMDSCANNDAVRFCLFLLSVYLYFQNTTGKY